MAPIVHIVLFQFKSDMDPNAINKVSITRAGIVSLEMSARFHLA